MSGIGVFEETEQNDSGVRVDGLKRSQSGEIEIRKDHRKDLWTEW